MVAPSFLASEILRAASLFLLRLSLEGVTKSTAFISQNSDTLRITAAEVALKDLFFCRVEVHGAEGTDCDAGAAANADIVINMDPSLCLIAIDCLYRAHVQARCVYALPACHGDVKAFPFPFLYFDTGL